VRLANLDPEVQRRGGEIVAVSVDSPGRNAAMAARWHLTFPLVSDPGGERFLQPLALWNPDARGGIGAPALIVVAPDGREVWRIVARDYADRPVDDVGLLAALDELALPPVDRPRWEPGAEPEETGDALRADALAGYMRGVRSGALAMLMRTKPDETAHAEAQLLATMATSFLDAWKERRASSAAES
jgi:hypothetical protein